MEEIESELKLHEPKDGNVAALHNQVQSKIASDVCLRELQTVNRSTTYAFSAGASLASSCRHRCLAFFGTIKVGRIGKALNLRFE